MNICVRCDRGQIYCEICQNLCKKKRIKKARKKYNESPKGRKKKSGQNQRRYNRPKKQEKKDFQGDRGSPLNSDSISNAPPVISLAEGVKNESHTFNRDSEKAKPRISENKEVKVVCAFCSKECAPYRRPELPWRQVRKLWLRGGLYSKRGFTS